MQMMTFKITYVLPDFQLWYALSRPVASPTNLSLLFSVISRHASLHVHAGGLAKWSRVRLLMRSRAVPAALTQRSR
jgi:hypothetical protein